MKRLFAAVFTCAMLCACGAPPFDTAQGVEQPLNGSQAVLPASSFGGDLLYVTNAKKLGPNKYVGLIEVLTFPQGKPYATIHLHGFANGLCTDASGNVWAVAGEKHDWQAYEYAHGGTTPILRIRIKNAHSYAEGCAIDPGSGDLAVLTGAYEGSGIRSYAYIWKGAKPGKPASYPLTFTPAACAYDATGNLFIDGWIGSTVFFALDKLAKGSNAVMKVAIDKALYGYPGGVEWDGTYIDAVSVSRKSHGTAIFQMQVSGYSAHVAGIVRPKSLYYSTPFYLTGGFVVGSSGSSGQDVAYWSYPGGGKPIATLDTLQYGIHGVAVSVAGSK